MATEGLLCRKHSERLYYLIGDIVELWGDLDLIIENGSAPKEGSPRTRHLKADSPPAPANLEVLSLRDSRSVQISPNDPPAVPAIIGSWFELLVEERPLTAAQPQMVAGRLNILRRHHNWIIQQTWVDDYSNELTGLKKALKSALRDHAYTSYGPCPHCSQSLYAENGSEVVRCSGCRLVWATAQELARLSVMREQA
jgi:hypothetical protein